MSLKSNLLKAAGIGAVATLLTAGAAFAANEVPIVVAPPGRLSTMTLWPRMPVRPAAQNRVSASNPDPGGFATMMRIGLVG